MADGRNITRLAAKAILGAAALAVAAQVAGLTDRAPPSPAVASAPVPPRAAPKVAKVTRKAVPYAPTAGQAPEQPYVIKRVLPVKGPLRHGEYVWDVAGVPEGALIITVDLAAGTLSAFRAGYEIGTAAVIYGADEKPTPLGVFPITEKDADHVSNLYHAPMPYMLRLTNDGVSIHGSEVTWDTVTHGCIGIPVKFARLLFAEVKLGDRVIVTRGEMLDVGKPIAAAAKRT